MRTRPVGLADAGAWPIVAGGLMVLAGVPAMAWAAIVAINLARRMAGASPAEAGNAAVIDVLAPLAFSPLLSWAGLVVAVPMAVTLARRGLAGWLVALLAGAGLGLLAWAVLVPLSILTDDDGRTGPVLMAVGLVLGGAFWLGARWARPAAFAAP